VICVGRIGIPFRARQLVVVVVVVFVAFVVVVVDGTVTGGVVGTTVLDPREPTMGNTVGVGIAAEELTPRLPISQEPSGIPVRGLPPGVAGVVDVGVVGDVAMLPELNPHNPDTPTVPVP
jgi:hypothetical protein